MTVLLLTAASILALFAAFDLKKWRSADLDFFVVVWIVMLAAWPSFIIYLVAPLIWTTAEQSGSLFPALQYTPALMMSCWAFWKGLRDRQSQVNIAAVILSTLFLFSAVGIVVEGGVQLINLAVAIGLFVGVVLPKKTVTLQSVGMGAVVSIAIMTVATTIATAVNRGATLGSCRIDKCNVLGEALTSPFAGNGNILGLAVVLLTPFALAIVSPFRVIILIAAVAAVQEVASSRTAAVGFGAAVVTVGLLRLLPHFRAKMAVAIVAGLVGLGISVFPLYGDYSSDAFSFRGYLWDAAEKLISSSPVFGHGATYWWVMEKSALFDANYSPHNGWFDIAVGIGLWGALIIVIAVYVHLKTTAPATRPYLIAYYCCVLTISAFESVYVPYYLGITPFAAIVPLILYDPARSPVTDTAPTGVVNTASDGRGLSKAARAPDMSDR